MQCVQNLAICLEAGWGVSRAADIKGSGSEMLSKPILVSVFRCFCLLKFMKYSRYLDCNRYTNVGKVKKSIRNQKGKKIQSWDWKKKKKKRKELICAES